VRLECNGERLQAMRQMRTRWGAGGVAAAWLWVAAAGEAPAPAGEAAAEAEASRRLERGDYQGAAALYEQVLSGSEPAFGPLFGLARAYHEAGDAPAFEAAIRRLLAFDPRRAEVFVLIGVRAQRDGRFADAEKAYRRALELQPDQIDGLSGLAEVCLAQGFREEGLGYLRRIAARYPSNVAVLWLLARSVEDPEEERRIYTQILAASPQGDEVARGRLNLLEALTHGGFMNISGLLKPERVRLFFTPSRTSKAQFISQEDGPMGTGYHRRATPNTPFVHVKVNGQGPFNFLLDTGTQGIHVSRTLMRRLGLVSYGTSKFEGLGLQAALYGDIVFLDSLHLDKVEVRRVPAEGIDLVGIGDGILNPAALRQLRVHLENSRRTLTLSRFPEPGESDPMRPRADNRRGRPVTLPFLSFSGQIVIRVEIQGMPANALIDTGAESSVLDLSVLRKLPGLDASPAAGYGVSLEGISGEVVEAQVVREVQINLAEENLRIENLFAADLRRLANFYGPEIHAVLGMKQLALFDVTFDFRRHQITFQRILR